MRGKDAAGLMCGGWLRWWRCPMGRRSALALPTITVPTRWRWFGRLTSKSSQKRSRAASYSYVHIAHQYDVKFAGSTSQLSCRVTKGECDPSKSMVVLPNSVSTHLHNDVTAIERRSQKHSGRPGADATPIGRHLGAYLLGKGVLTCDLPRCRIP